MRIMERKEYMEEIIYRHLNKEASEQEEAELLSWLQKDLANKIEYDELSQIWKQSSRLATDQYFDESSAWASLEKKINAPYDEKNIFKPRVIVMRPLTIAASILLIAFCAGIVYYFIRQHEPEQVIV